MSSETFSAAPESVSTRVFINTPEHIQFSCEQAGIAPRMLAWLIDTLIRGLTMVLLYLAITGLTGGMAFGEGILLVAFFIMEWGYCTLFEWLWDGCTPGKKVLQLRVVRTDGVSLDLYRSAMRNVLRAADSFPFFTYGVGILSCFVSGKGRRLGDLAADTMVIREERKALSALPALPGGAPLFSLEELQKAGITGRALAPIDAFFRRRRLFSQDRSREISLILAQPLAKVLGRPADESPELLLAGILLSSEDARLSFSARESISPSHSPEMSRGAP